MTGQPPAAGHPYATGGGGDTFEKLAAAQFLAALLLMIPVPGLPGPVTRVALQQRYAGSSLDDIVVEAAVGDGVRRLEIQVRHRLQLSMRNVKTRQLFAAMAETVQNDRAAFLQRRRMHGIITAQGSPGIHNLIELTERARSVAEPSELASQVRAIGLLSRGARELAIRISGMLGEIDHGDLDLETLQWLVLGSLIVMPWSLEGANAIEPIVSLDRLASVLVPPDVAEASKLVGALRTVAADYAREAGSLTRASLLATLSATFRIAASPRDPVDFSAYSAFFSSYVPYHSGEEQRRGSLQALAPEDIAWAPKVTVLLGPPGIGKSTEATRLLFERGGGRPLHRCRTVASLVTLDADQVRDSLVLLDDVFGDGEDVLDPVRVRDGLLALSLVLEAGNLVLATSRDYVWSQHAFRYRTDDFEPQSRSLPSEGSAWRRELLSVMLKRHGNPDLASDSAAIAVTALVTPNDLATFARSEAEAFITGSRSLTECIARSLRTANTYRDAALQLLRSQQPLERAMADLLLLLLALHEVSYGDFEALAAGLGLLKSVSFDSAVRSLAGWLGANPADPTVATLWHDDVRHGLAAAAAEDVEMGAARLVAILLSDVITLPLQSALPDRIYRIADLWARPGVVERLSIGATSDWALFLENHQNALLVASDRHDVLMGPAAKSFERLRTAPILSFCSAAKFYAHTLYNARDWEAALEVLSEAWERLSSTEERPPRHQHIWFATLTALCYSKLGRASIAMKWYGIATAAADSASMPLLAASSPGAQQRAAEVKFVLHELANHEGNTLSSELEEYALAAERYEEALEHLDSLAAEYPQYRPLDVLLQQANLHALAALSLAENRADNAPEEPADSVILDHIEKADFNFEKWRTAVGSSDRHPRVANASRARIVYNRKIGAWNEVEALIDSALEKASGFRRGLLLREYALIQFQRLQRGVGVPQTTRALANLEEAATLLGDLPTEERRCAVLKNDLQLASHLMAPRP
jgi:tetratricopeptide (TPR) repeat protein